MNILRVISSLNPTNGGPCQGIRNSVPELEKLGAHNEVVCLDDPDAAFLGKDSFPIHAIGSGRGPWNYNEKLLPWFMKNLGRFDVVIVHGLWLYHSYAVKQALSRLEKQHKQYGDPIPKLFIMPHGMLDPYFQQASNRKLKALRNWVYWKLIEGGVVNGADGILFTCEAELKLAREPFQPYHPRREINVGYGIGEPPPFSPAMRKAFLERCPELKNRPYLLFLSRIHEKKGVDLLIKAYSEIVRNTINKIEVATIEDPEVGELKDPELPVLVVAGPGLETFYGESMQQLADEFNFLNTSVLFPGMLTSEAKWGAFYGCEAFLLPSHQENFGIAVVEALACNKPVLISNQVNIWQEIEAAGCGLVAEDTLEGTKKLLNSWQTLSAEQKLAMYSQARTTYKNSFAIQPHALQLLKAIR